MNRKIGNITNYLAALILIIMGLIYLFKNSFMPYHSEAVSMDWSEVESNLQHLLVAFMRAVSGGFLAVAISIILLQRKFSMNKTSWIPLIILITGLVVNLSALYATMIVRFNTPGNPPTTLAIVGFLLLIIAYIFNRMSLKEN
ncbi:MAG: hypothetical protein GQ564_23150 [Bacteroidales bacterium]|nr:hypothetical protein [Bacteroidales bacterium]